MGSSTKKKDKESRKRRREESHDSTRDKRHKHKKHHHKEKKHKSSKHVYETEENSSRRRYEPEEKSSKYNYESDGSDVVEIVENDQQAPPSPPAVPPLPALPQHSSKDIEAASSSQGAESLSIEETNKLRAKLGLKPLQVASSASNSSTNSNKKGNNELKKDDLGEFYHKPAENLQLKAQQEKLRAKLSEIREKRQLNNKYSKVKTLGEGSDDEDDILSWVDKSREIDKAKKDAEKRARMLEELDSQFGINDIVESERREKMRSGYTAKHLKGLTVQHDLDSFGEGRSVVLTLKDKGVLEDDEDVLVNVNMIDDERYKKKQIQLNPTMLYNSSNYQLT
nr:U4/U6.U5 tri-snRNP-associated protein 1-like [Leptinotarsa decemlineata]